MLKKRIITTAVFLLIAGYAFQDARADIPASERNALADLYSSTGGAGWNDSTGWNSSPGTECGWYGVTCDSEVSHVTMIDLSSNSLKGNIPGSLKDLTELSLINLSYNSLSGSIPDSVANLANLAALDLGVNSLTGNIPTGLGNISSLRYIFLHYNRLTGEIPPELGNLAKLRLLKLGNNELTGSIPAELGNLADLQYLTLYKNRLQGSIPPELGNLAKLRELSLQSNMLSGGIPTELGNLASLAPGKSDFRWNALYTDDDSLSIFLSTVQDSGDWESTQTVAPVNPAPGTPAPASVPLSWTGGGFADEYEIVYAANPGGPYTAFGTVAGKEAEVTGLAPGRTWYFRVRSVAYPHADNLNTVFSGYSEEVSAVTLGFTLPEVTTADISSVTVSSASGGGNVTSDTSVKITARGVCWNTSSVPDTVNPSEYTCPSDGSGTGSFTSEITGLDPGMIYHVRAYAVCSTGAVFGNSVIFTTLPEEPVPLPKITVTAPADGTFFTENMIVVSGTARSGLNIVSVTVNGAEALKVPESGSEVFFKHTVYFSSGTDLLQITVIATDLARRTGTVTLTAEYDNTAPVITFSSPDPAPAGEIIPVTETPYTVSGTVVEKNLAGVSINGKNFYVLPSVGDDSWFFEGSAALVRGQEFPAIIEAWDHAGNRTYYELVLRLDSALEIEVITPKQGAEFVVNEPTFDVNITVRVPGIAENDTVRVSIDGAEATTLNISGITANGTLNIAASDGKHRLVAEAVSTAGDVLAETSASFTVINMMNIPLSLERQDPENNARNIEPDAFIAFYFNKTAEPQQLEIKVLETVHGLVYETPKPGADLTQHNKIGFIEVHRDREPVPGGISHFQYNNMAAFYPARYFAYGGTVYTEIRYKGKELARSVFNIRPLPTFIRGFVSDQFGNQLEGIKVELPELGMKAVTDKDGAYGFGFRESAGQAVPPGRHKAIINSRMKNSAFGTVTIWLYVEQGRLNSVGVTPLPFLNHDEPFRRVRSGQAQAVLASGELILDFHDVLLRFPDQRNEGDVHVQFTEMFRVPYRSLPSAMPQWLFAVQPAGIEVVSGNVGIAFSMLPLHGTYNYVSQIGDRVVLVGLNPNALLITPVGVGFVDTEKKQVLSEGKVELKHLDYLGYAVAVPDMQPILEQYAKGKISLVRMIAELESLRQ